MDGTITEQDMDARSQQFVQGFRQDLFDAEPDLEVDGLTESVASRLLRMFSFGRS